MSEALNIDLYIEMLKVGRMLSVPQLEDLIRQSKDMLSKEPNIPSVKAPVTVVGDIHGQLYDLLELFRVCGEPPYTNLLFLGDYVDRGNNSLECFCLVLALKVRFRDRITILRGNHESCEINKVYGFYDECFKKYGNERIWILFTEVFACLPLAAVVEGKIFCLHGGLSPSLSSVDEMQKLKRFVDVPHKGPICDLLWSDPDENGKGFTASPRSAGFLFGQDMTSNFLHVNSLTLIARAHQLVMDGYNRLHRKCVTTIFSAPNYCSRCGNQAAIMEVDDQLHSTYTQFYQALNTPEPQVVARCPDYFL